MTATQEQLRRAHTRMLGRIDAANIEHFRALRAGDTQRALRASRDSLRRHRAGLRLLDAMRGAR